MLRILKYLGYHEAAQSPKTEVLAGGTTFLAMVYIVVVNPSILSDAGMDFGAVFVATCLAAAFGSLMMGGAGPISDCTCAGHGSERFL